MPKPTVVAKDVLIEVSRGVDEAVSALEAAAMHTSLVMSAVTEVTLFSMFREPEKVIVVEQFLDRFTILPLTSRITRFALDLCQQYGWDEIKFGDMLIAATAIVHEMTLLTSRQEFRKVEGLEILPYPDPFG